MWKLKRYLQPFIWTILMIVLLTFIQTQTNLALPDYMSDIVNKGIIGRDESYIIEIGIKMLGVSLVGALCAIATNYLAAKVGSGFSRKLRNEIFSKVESFSLNEFEKFSTASLITRTTNDVQQVQQMTIMSLRIVLMAPLMGIGGLFRALDKSPNLAWIIGLVLIIIVIFIGTIVKVLMPSFNKLQILIDKLNLVTRENLVGLRVIRAFNAENKQQEKFEDANMELAKTNLFVQRLMSLLFPTIQLIMNLASLTIIYFGAKYIDMGTLEIGNMMAFLQYSMQILMSFLMLTMVFAMLPRANVSANRINEVLETENEIKDPIDNKEFISKFDVKFNNVSFKYPDAEELVLYDLNFTCNEGETTAFIGSTGSGKSTLINLIPRFYDASEGSITIGGIDIREITQKQLHEKIGYVPQKGVLFSGTIRENISYGNDLISDEELEKVSKVAQAYDFIQEKENKFNEEISQGGKNVSGGQKQRLSIARALAKNPPIFIFDDSFSALDYKTDSILRKELKKHTNNATVIIVAQRISTIRYADKIVVLDEGRVVGTGKHEELMKNCKVYQEIATSQLSQEELNHE